MILCVVYICRRAALQVFDCALRAARWKMISIYRRDQNAPSVPTAASCAKFTIPHRCRRSASAIDHDFRGLKKKKAAQDFLCLLL